MTPYLACVQHFIVIVNHIPYVLNWFSQDTVNAVLDKLIKRVPGRKRTYTVYYDLLEANKDGIIVRNPNKIALRRRLGKSAFDRIAWTGNKVLSLIKVNPLNFLIF